MSNNALIIIIRREHLDIPDGINIFIFSLADEFIRKNFQVLVISSYKIKEEDIKKYFKSKNYPKTLSLSSQNKMNHLQLALLWIKKGKDIVNKLKPDMIILNGVLPVKFNSYTIAVSHDIETSGRFKSNLLRRLYKYLSYKKVDQIVATTNEIKEALSNEIKVNSKNIKVIPTCFNINEYKGKEINFRENAILHIGTNSYKNPLTTIKAFSFLHLPNAKLYITGNIELVKVLLNQVKKEIRERIFCPGYLNVREFNELLGKVKIVSVPSVYNVPVASPSVIEALSSGTPIVCSESISSSIIKNGYNGFICKTNDVNSYVERYQEILTNDELWNYLNKNAVISSKAFSAEIVVSNYLELMLNK